MKRPALVAIGVLVLGGGVAWYVVAQDGKGSGRKTTDTGATATETAPVTTTTFAPAASEESAVAVHDAGSATWAGARWGSRRGELGRSSPTEGNPEGPMSFTVAGHDLFVLDQVNGRLVRYDAHGHVIGSSTIPETVQDVAVAKDGTTALLDRLAGKTVSLTDASGRRIGELPLTGDTGSLTGVFVDGKDVYVEQDHGGLVNVGTTDGQPPGSPPAQLGGRPSKDGTLLLTATLAAPVEGKVTVNAIDRAHNELRFARLVQVARPASVIVLLDTDARGTIYVGVDAGEPETANVVCMDPGDGHVVGRVNLPLSSGPEETFRDFSVDDDGNIVYALRTDQGVTYASAHCP